MNKEKVNQLMEIEELREPLSIGEIFFQSGLFPDIKTQSQAVVKILAGKELGLSPFQSMKDIYIVNGKLAIQSNALAAIIKGNNRYDYHVDTLTNEECKITFFKIVGDKKEEIGVSEFTFKDAAKAGLANKENWKAYPRNMMFARALANGVRFYCPDAACGWMVTEEAENIYDINERKTIEITENGEVKNVETNSEIQ